MITFLTLLFVFPVAPHWFMKATASIFGISIAQFLPAVTIGLMPYNWITTSAGSMLASLTSKNEVFDQSTTMGLMAASGLGLVLVMLKRRLLPRAHANAAVHKKLDLTDADIDTALLVL
jgi:uncharacterized membrane protein YdjX (TVP38/TMEM64 family)